MYQMKKGGSKSAKQQAAIAMSMKKAGKKPKMKMGGGVDNSNFAKLAPPYNKATYADKIAGAKKNAGEMKKRGGSVGTSKIKKYRGGGPFEGKPVIKGIMDAIKTQKQNPASSFKPMTRNKMSDKIRNEANEEKYQKELKNFQKDLYRKGTNSYESELIRTPFEMAKPQFQEFLSPPKVGNINKKRMGGSCGTPKSLRKGK